MSSSLPEKSDVNKENTFEALLANPVNIPESQWTGCLPLKESEFLKTIIKTRLPVTLDGCANRYDNLVFFSPFVGLFKENKVQQNAGESIR